MRNDSLYIKDLIGSIEKILTYVHQLSYESFLNDEKTIDAVLRNFQIMGEAVKGFSDVFRVKYKEIDWKLIAGMRDKITHAYFGVDFELVWYTIENDLPPLLTSLKLISSNLENKKS